MAMEPLYTTRRDFLGGALTVLSAAATLPLFLGRTARVLAATQPATGARGDSHRILVVIQLAGGNDGLNMVVPSGMDEYYRYRRQLAIPPRDVLPLADGVGLHPSATGLKALHDAGRLAIVQGVGYPNPNRSHFTSTDIWMSGDPHQRSRHGWLGRYFDAACDGADPGPDPLDGIALTSEPPLALLGDRFMPLSFSSAAALTWRGPRNDARAAEAFVALNRPDDIPAERPAVAPFLQRAALDAHVGAERIRTAAGRTQRRSGPLGANPLLRQLDLVGQMIRADLPTRVYYVSLGGFDTHSAQLGRHRTLMQQLGDGLRTFADDLAADKLLDRVLVMTFSEFGRRVQENASGGTDHGEAAPMLLAGATLRPGLHEPHPDLRRLNRGDLAFGCDFRRVYATVLQDWLETPAAPILGGTHRPLRLYARARG